MSTATRTGTLRPHEPFDLIRLLARSQTDPRKAVAELVQNSLDAGARRVFVTRARERGAVVLKIADDGEGVLPDLARDDALEHLARNIGHSRKHGLTLEQRRGALGRYGIGLLGFWSIGEELELRTRVAAGRTRALRLEEDRPGYRIVGGALSPSTDGDPLGDPTCTEVVIRCVHEVALGALAGRRLQSYLAFELRGQLRDRGVRVVVRDGLARGRAARIFRVEPHLLEGAPLPIPGPLDVPGFRPARLELRVVSSETRAAVALACEGAVVADDLAREPSLGLDHPPWTDPRLSGVVDFPDLAPAPGSRRGIVPNRAAEALRTALLASEAAVASALREAREAPARELEREALDRLRRAFSNLTLELPRYELLGVATPRVARGEGGGGPGLALDAPQSGERDESEDDDRDVPGEPGDPGDLARVALVPLSVVVAPGGARRVRAVACDAAGRTILGGLAFAWSVASPTLVRLADTDTARVVVGAAELEGATTLNVRVTSPSGRVLEATANVRVALPVPRPRTGIPDPVLVDDPAAAWRTRLREGRWEVNAGHRDYQLVRDRGERKLQYLAVLLAKEIVLGSEGDAARTTDALEGLAEVAAYALRQL